MSLFKGRDREGRREDAAADETPKPAPSAPRPASPGRSTAMGGTMANIGKSITIKGDLTGEEDLVIEGNIEGRIDLPGNQLTIGANGEIKADVHGKTVVVIGHVKGNVSATERVEIQASGIVDGDVRAPKLVIAEGAVLNGAVEMGGAAGKPKPAQAPAAAPKAVAS